MAEDTEEQLTYDLECRKEPKKQPRILFAGDVFEGQPYLIVTEDDISLSADRKHTFSLDPKFGLGLSGAVSISSLPDELSFCGGFWRLDPRHLSTIASTTPTPIPVLKKAVPRLTKAVDSIKGALDFAEKFSNIGKK